MSTDRRTIKWYNNFAQEYTDHVRDENDSIYHSLYEKPAMYNLLPDLKGAKVISIGCGSGEDCNQLQKRGAKVTGIDISDGLIAIAKKSYPKCSFQTMNMEDLKFKDSSFDFAYSSLAIHYLEDWSQALTEAYRVLKPGSSYLLSCGHPVYSAMYGTTSARGEAESVLRWKKNKINNVAEVTGNYIERREMSYNEWFVWNKSLDEISTEIAQAGFVIDLIHEPKPLPKMKDIAPMDYEVLMRIPNFIIFKLRKV